MEYLIVEDKKSGSLYTIRGIDGPDGDGVRYLPCESSEAALTSQGTRRRSLGDFEHTNCPVEGSPYENIGAVTIARVVSDDTALLVKDLQSGKLELIQEPGPFFPTPYQQVAEDRSLIRVAEHETVLLPPSSAHTVSQAPSQISLSLSGGFVLMFASTRTGWADHCRAGGRFLRLPLGGGRLERDRHDLRRLIRRLLLPPAVLQRGHAAVDHRL